jgi:hypothetical protein
MNPLNIMNKEKAIRKREGNDIEKRSIYAKVWDVHA